MSLTICTFCRARVRPNKLELHYKRCPKRRLALKKKTNVDHDVLTETNEQNKKKKKKKSN